MQNIKEFLKILLFIWKRDDIFSLHENDEYICFNKEFLRGLLYIQRENNQIFIIFA